MNENTIKTIQLIVIIAVVFVVFRLLKKYGFFGQSEADAAEDEFNASSKFEPYRILFEPNKYKFNLPKKDIDSLIAMSVAKASTKDYETMIEAILGAKNFLNDKESDAYEAFKKIGSIEELVMFSKYWKMWIDNHPSQVRLYYLENPDKANNLGAYLSSYLDGGDFTKLKSILSQLKHFKK